MGQAMARRLLEADHDLVVYNRTPEKLAEIASLGAGVSKSIGEAARHGGVVVTMLADDTALAHVGRGPGGLVETLPQGGVHIAMGTHQIRSEEHTSELQSLMRTSYAVFCLKKKKRDQNTNTDKIAQTQETTSQRIPPDHHHPDDNYIA